MAYNKINYYKRVLEIQEIVLEKQALGLKNTTIYEMHIRDKYHISKSTFDNYLSVPAKRELKRLEREAEAVDNQLNLFNDV